MNYRVTSALNVNLNGYYLGPQTQYHATDPYNEAGLGNVDRKLISNITISYDISSSVNVRLLGKNLLDQSSREYIGSDETGFMGFLGLNVSL